MDIYNSILAILIHILIIILLEGITYYVLILPNAIKSLYISIYNNLFSDKDINLRALIYFIFVNYYNSNKLYTLSYDENTNINDENKNSIIIFIAILLSLFLLIVGFIIFYKYKLNIQIQWKFILSVVILTIISIGVYELIFILYIYYNIDINEYNMLYQIMHKLYLKYYNSNKNYDLEIKNKINSFKLLINREI